VDGQAALYVERGGSTYQTLPAADDPAIAEAAIRSLTSLARDGRVREVTVTRVDGLPVGESPVRDVFLAAGFVPAYRGFVFRVSGRTAPETGDGRLTAGRNAPAARDGGLGRNGRGAAPAALVGTGRRRA
jgi:hypothetical protein